MGEDVNEHKPINDYGRKVGWNFFLSEKVLGYWRVSFFK